MALPDNAAISDSLTKLEQLNQLEDLMASYVIKNYLLIGKAPQAKVVEFYNPNLYRVAVQYYGDANLWTVIASANNLSDPKVDGFVPLLIPPKPSSDNGGILNPPAALS